MEHQLGLDDLDQFFEFIAITNVAQHQLVIVSFLKIPNIPKTCGCCQGVIIGHGVALIHGTAHHNRSDESSATRHQYLHFCPRRLLPIGPLFHQIIYIW